MTISLIVSNDSIAMNLPYDITSNILKSITSICEKIGEVNANFLNKPSPQLIEQNTKFWNLCLFFRHGR